MISMTLALILLMMVIINAYYTYALLKFDRRLIRLSSVANILVDAPRVSIIVPIHNEAQKLEAALGSMCELDYPNFEVIAVNDRSTDDSLEIMQRLKAKHCNLKLLTIEHLPQDWLGKTHALQQGLNVANGELILFTDADVRYEASLLCRAVRLMQQQRLDHLTLAPFMLLTHWFMKLFIPFQIYCMLISIRPWQSNNDDPKQSIGIGAFNLVTRQALNTIGELTALRLNPVDDIGLARLLKKQAARQAYADPEKLLSISWYDSFKQAAIGLEKNTLAFFEYSYVKCMLMFVAYGIFFYLPWLALFFMTPIIALLSLANIFLIVMCLTSAYQKYRLPIALALGYPFIAFFPLYVGVRSVFLCWFRGGIVWGNQFYSIERLKAFHNTNKQ